MNAGQFLKAGLDAGMHAGDEFELRFAEIGRDAGMGQSRTQRGRVRQRGQLAVRKYPQAFLFDAAPDGAQIGGRERAQVVV